MTCNLIQHVTQHQIRVAQMPVLESRSPQNHCVDSEFSKTYDVQIKTFEEPVKQEPKEFILTTLKQIGAA